MYIENVRVRKVPEQGRIKEETAGFEEIKERVHT